MMARILSAKSFCPQGTVALIAFFKENANVAHGLCVANRDKHDTC